jgi:16S rRNA G966 N2-methylase RsmD
MHVKKRTHAAEGLSTAQVATLAGIHRDTLLRWLRESLIQEPTRDRRGWRVFSRVEAEAIVRFAKSETPPKAVAEQGGEYASHAEIRRLGAIDWDFRDAKTSYLTHGLHPYPAKYIPQIPNALIQELSSVGERVADVFCGSGTTLVEALTLKRHAVGVDANPLACLISQAKTTRVTTEDAEILQEISQRADRHAQDLSLRTIESLFGDLPFKSEAPRPTSEALSFWFHDFVVEELAEILAWCRAIKSDAAKCLALNAFSSIVVVVSKQDSDTRYVRREKKLLPGETFKKFGRALSEASRAATELSDIVEARFSAEVINASVLDRPDIGSVDLVVCSPPYPNAYSYHLYHMTRMLWLAMDQPRFKGEEIGSHRKYSQKGPNGATAATFEREMAEVLQWLGKHLRKGRYACFVVGPSTLAGRKVDNARLLARAAGQHGFHEVARFNRRLHEGKKAFNPAIGKIKDEAILVLHRRYGATR